MSIDTLRNQKGAIFAFVMLMVIILAILAGVFSATVIANYSIAKANQVSQTAYYIAQAGIEYGIYIVKNTLTPTSPATWPQPNVSTLNICGGSVTISIAALGSDYTITSKGTSGSKQRTIKADVTSSGVIKQWY